MKYLIIKYIIYYSKYYFWIFLLCSCINDDYYIPTIPCYELKPSTASHQLIQSLPSDSLSTINEDDLLEMFVISSDQEKNINKLLYLVDKDGINSIFVQIDYSYLYQNFNIGNKVYLSTKNLTFFKDTFGVQVGIYDKTLEKIPPMLIKNYFFVGCSSISEDSLVHKITFNDMHNLQYLNTLIEIDSIYFDKAGNPFFEGNSSGINRYIFNKKGEKISIRVNSLASFANTTIPSGYGTIRGILIKYYSTYQLLIRDIKDLKF